jgi:hypothetical protein
MGSQNMWGSICHYSTFLNIIRASVNYPKTPPKAPISSFVYLYFVQLYLAIKNSGRKKNVEFNLLQML